ncbi:bifunctional diguanylate cyclase/phosphodiesterase [Candidatus Terasakiella magnetica]|uniref:bifunctional diguanylate cyclase/phosphodiesterase n=1 Tax=Candidatus Terasakiella magnetica TaxID=1867952 RepID=UPI0013F4E244|nr:EAL domain-containing protein [Candidatus Terasakiella magnetica]
MVFLSFFIALLASYVALTSARLTTKNNQTFQRVLHANLGGAALAIGVWSMHYIGMLAYNIGLEISYNVELTLLSLLPISISSLIVLPILGKARASQGKIILCSLILALGVGGMHYIGMASISADISMVHISSLFIFSLIAAVILAYVAIDGRYRLINHAHPFLSKHSKLFTSALLATSVTAMHYIAMEAVIFYPGSLCVKEGLNIAGNEVHFTILISILILLGVIIIVDWATKAQESADILSSVLTVSSTGHALVDKQGNILFASQALAQITGYSLEELSASNIDILLPQGIRAQHHHYLEEEHSVKSSNIMGENREVDLRRKDDLLIPIEINVSPIRKGGNIVYVTSIKDLSEQKKREYEKFKVENFNKLTGISNRRMLRTKLTEFLESHEKLFVVNLYFHNLTNINKSYNFETGNQFIKQIGELLHSFENENCFLAHFGALEFAFIIASDKNYDIELLMSELRNKTQTGIIIDAKELPLTFNAGVAIYPQNGINAEQLETNSLTAMARSINKGPNTYSYHIDHINEHTQRQYDIEYELRHALEKSELSLVFQPKVDSTTHGFIGAEALIRWTNEKLGFVSPTEFIPIAEKSGLIIPIGSWIIDQGCKQARNLLDRGYDNFTVALNVSPRQVIQDIILEKLEAALHKYDLDGRYIEVEVTEGLFLEGSTTVDVQLEAIKIINASLALDDFGTGYSSISYLRDYPFDTLKIDQSFIRTLDIHDPDATGLVRAIVKMGHALNMKIVAEGVETKEHADFLKEEGCQILQGYYFAKPMAEPDLLNWLKAHD